MFPLSGGGSGRQTGVNPGPLVTSLSTLLCISLRTDGSAQPVFHIDHKHTALIGLFNNPDIINWCGLIVVKLINNGEVKATGTASAGAYRASTGRRPPTSHATQFRKYWLPAVLQSSANKLIFCVSGLRCLSVIDTGIRYSLLLKRCK